MDSYRKQYRMLPYHPPALAPPPTVNLSAKMSKFTSSSARIDLEMCEGYYCVDLSFVQIGSSGRSCVECCIYRLGQQSLVTRVGDPFFHPHAQQQVVDGESVADHAHILRVSQRIVTKSSHVHTFVSRLIV